MVMALLGTPLPVVAPMECTVCPMRAPGVIRS